jgi:hypothetical protein
VEASAGSLAEHEFEIHIERFETMLKIEST